MPIHTKFYRAVIWTSKVGQRDLVFDVRSGFASGSVHARLQISVYSGYDLCHRGCPKTGGLFTIGRTTGVRPTPVVRHPCDVEGYSRSMSHVRQPHAGRKFDRRSTTSTDMSYDL